MCSLVFDQRSLSVAGVSDFHLMTLTVMSETFKEIATKETFNLSNEALINNDDGLDRFCKLCVETSNKFTAIKKVCSSQSNSFS